jgi:dienelactone hydrolase
MRHVGLVSAAIAALAVSACASPGPPAYDGPPAGVVVLHAERDDPYGHTLLFTRTLQAHGLLTDSPEMPWSEKRSNDKGPEGAMAEIDWAVARLASRGARKIFVAGESAGAVAAVRYAGRRRVDGLVALAPSQAPDAPKLAAAVRPGTPVLWVVGRGEDEGLKKADRIAFDALPKDPAPKFVEVSGGHLETASGAAVLSAEWIREVAKR